MATQDSTSLYEELGGVCSIATVIDDFLDRITVDPCLDANPRVDEVHHRVSPADFKRLKPNGELVSSRFGASGKSDTFAVSPSRDKSDGHVYWSSRGFATS
jgi:hypothetical protein